MPEIRAKGVSFRSSLRALETIRGKPAVESTLDALTPALAETIRMGEIVTSGWYPLDWYRELHHTAQRVLHEGPELTHAISREAVQYDFRGVYRLVTLTLSPQMLFSLASRVVSLYWGGGVIAIDEAEKGKASARFTEFDGFDRTLWEDVKGGARGIMELAGAKDLTMRVTEGGGDGDAKMRLVVRWS